MPLTDTLNRPLRDLRISVTDLCNFRCPYCMPKEIFGTGHRFLPKSELLTFEEITRIAPSLTPEELDEASPSPDDLPGRIERLARLAADQRAAATAEPGPVLCVAPAGSETSARSTSASATRVPERVAWRW